MWGPSMRFPVSVPHCRQMSWVLSCDGRWPPGSMRLAASENHCDSYMLWTWWLSQTTHFQAYISSILWLCIEGSSRRKYRYNWSEELRKKDVVRTIKDIVRSGFDWYLFHRLGIMSGYCRNMGKPRHLDFDIVEGMDLSRLFSSGTSPSRTPRGRVRWS